MILTTVSIQSNISIYTHSHSEAPDLLSSTLVEYQGPENGSMGRGGISTSLIQRILSYAYNTVDIIESREVRSVSNDLQSILSCPDNVDPRYNRYNNSYLRVQEDIVQVRNLMNLAQGLAIEREWNSRI